MQQLQTNPSRKTTWKSAVEILGELQETSTGEFDDQNLCQACKEELGMLSLMGFGEWGYKFS